MASTRPEVISWDVDGTFYSMPRMMRAVMWLGFKGMFSPRVFRNVSELRALSRLRKAMRAIRESGGALGPEGMPANRTQLLEFERRWYGRALARVGPRDGLLWVIGKLAESGVRQIVVSDYVSDYKLEILGLAGAFERVYAGEELGYLKPAGALFEAVSADLGVPAERILHIGDRADTDAVAAGLAGCGVAIIGREIDSVRELAEPAHLGRLLSASPGRDG